MPRTEYVSELLARLQRQLAEGHLTAGHPWIGPGAVGELDVRGHGVVDAPESGRRLGEQEGGVGLPAAAEVGSRDDGPQVGKALLDQVVPELGPGDVEQSQFPLQFASNWFQRRGRFRIL